MAVVLGLPSVALAQASITGTVRDTSGAVLPGVTVEASSPAVIEKVRTATTDGNGSIASWICGQASIQSRFRSRDSQP
jgi:hypothetical protein